MPVSGSTSTSTMCVAKRAADASADRRCRGRRSVPPVSCSLPASSLNVSVLPSSCRERCRLRSATSIGVDIPRCAAARLIICRLMSWAGFVGGPAGGEGDAAAAGDVGVADGVGVGDVGLHVLGARCRAPRPAAWRCWCACRRCRSSLRPGHGAVGVDARRCSCDFRPLLNQKPDATPRPRFGARRALRLVVRAASSAASSVSIDADRADRPGRRRGACLPSRRS